MLLVEIGGFACMDACEETTYAFYKASAPAEFSLVVLFWQTPKDHNLHKNTAQQPFRNSSLKSPKARWRFHKQKICQLVLTWGVYIREVDSFQVQIPSS